MAITKNNALQRNHFHKDWQRRIRVWFDQPKRKEARRVARASKLAKAGGRPTELLRPAVRPPTVRYNMRLRAGRGFTLDELKAAKISAKQARSIGIAVDHRRRNRSEESLKLNAGRLEAYKQRLILLPRRAGKPKKGDSDATSLPADAVRSLQGRDGAFKIDRVGSVAEKPRAITDEERETDAYATLRRARSDARFVGVRKIRADKKAQELEAKQK